MDIYASDEEKAEEIKQWWRDNGLSIVMGVGLGVAGLFGFRYWEAQQVAANAEAAVAYDAVMSAENSTEAERLRTEFPDSIYATLSAFKTAQKSLQAGDMEASKTQLSWVIEHAELAAHKDLANLRLARILLTEGAYDDAIAIADSTTNAAFSSLFDEVRGDIYTAQENKSAAYAAYQSALSTADQARQLILQRKQDNVVVANER